MGAKISVAITVYNEAEELNRCINSIRDQRVFGKVWEIVIQGDKGKVTDDVLKVVNNHSDVVDRYVEHPLNGNFAAYKNNLFDVCRGDYILQLDADETVFGNHLFDRLEEYSNADLLFLPRINIVNGITKEDIDKWGWRVKKKFGFYDAINYPDYQGRFYQNSKHLEWIGKVHEKIIGSYHYMLLPQELSCSIYHEKSIDTQRKQNKFYSQNF